MFIYALWLLLIKIIPPKQPTPAKKKIKLRESGEQFENYFWASDIKGKINSAKGNMCNNNSDDDIP